MVELSEGQVVEFLDGQRFFCAVCLKKKDNRFHLITYLGRELNLSPARLLHISNQRINIQNREKTLEALQNIHSRREALQGQTLISEIWEILKDEGVIWNPRDVAELVFGKDAGPDHEAALIRAVITESIHFKFKEGALVLQDEEHIHKALEIKAKEKEQQERIERGKAILHAIWSEEPSTKEISLDDPHVSFWVEAIKDFCIKGTDSSQYLLVKNLFKNAGLNLSSAPFETLVKARIWNEDENLELHRYEIVTDFPKSLLDEGKRLASIKINRTNRIDLTSLDIFTIDGPETLDLDDAISFKKAGDDFEIGVHITDIGLKLGPDSPLFKEAIERATSIYLPDSKISMLPESLSQDAWSLMEGKYREALSFFAMLDKNGIIKHSRIIPSLIKVKKRLTYQEVDGDISKKGEFHVLHELCNQIQSQRIKNGALPLPIPELIIIIDENGYIHPRLLSLDPARFMVAECMILANSIAANFLKENRIPALFRSQPAPRERIIVGIEPDIKVNYQQRRLISKGDLGPKPEWHSGLGLGAYTTITSPLRRGLDLLMHQQIISFIQEKKPLHTRERLAKLKILLQEGLSKAAAVRQARTRYWMLKFFQKRIDVPMDAWILDSNQKIIAVLSDYLLPVELPKRQGMNFFFGQDVQICIKKSVPRENILKADWA